MRRPIGLVSVFLGAMVWSVPLGAPPAFASNFKSCEALVTQYPNGVAKSAVEATRWASLGYERPVVSTRVYEQAKRLGQKRGVICGETRTSIREANARAYSTLIATGTPTQLRAGGDMVAPGSPAGDYLNYWATTEEAVAWDAYGSRGVIQPPPTPKPVVRQSSGPVITFKIGDQANDVYTFSFDSQNRVQSFSTPGGPLEGRLRSISGAGSTAGVTIQAQLLYESNSNKVVFVGMASNNSGGSVGVLTDAVFNSSQGRLPATTTRPCLQPGQVAPIYAITQIPGKGEIPASWEFRLAADFGACNMYSNEAILTVPFS